MNEFKDIISSQNLAPLWDVLQDLVPEKPMSTSSVYVWRYRELRALLLEAGALISADDAERRVLILNNPGNSEKFKVTDSLYAGIQLVLPGETAPLHRHTQSALRFVVESDGGSTTVDGIRLAMEPYDLVLTPGGSWHEHKGGNTPTIWLDGLDIPIVSAFSATFAETNISPAELAQLQRHSATSEVSSSVPVITVSHSHCPVCKCDESSPGCEECRIEGDGAVLHFPYKVWSSKLDKLAASTEPDEYLGWMVEFISPKYRYSVLPTISAYAQKIPSRTKTKALRQSSGAVFFVVEGTVSFYIDEQNFELDASDVIAVPSWAKLQIKAKAQDVVLFSYSDRICHQKLGFWREERE